MLCLENEERKKGNTNISVRNTNIYVFTYKDVCIYIYTYTSIYELCNKIT